MTEKVKTVIGSFFSDFKSRGHPTHGPYLKIYQVGSIELSDKLIPDISKTVNFTACLTSPDSPLTLKII